jgi:hypothetical protein
MGQFQEMHEPYLGAILNEVRPAYARHDYIVQEKLSEQMNIRDLNMQLAVPLDINLDAGWETLPIDPGKGDKEIFQWVQDLEGLIARNREEIIAHIARNDDSLQGHLEEMAERMKSMWEHATADQRATWTELKRTTFGANELHTKLIEVICSFESRWIPQEHCACPICWEGGQMQKFSSLPDFVNHMKNAHKVGWKNVKDYWCMICSRAFGQNGLPNLPPGSQQQIGHGDDECIRLVSPSEIQAYT